MFFFAVVGGFPRPASAPKIDSQAGSQYRPAFRETDRFPAQPLQVGPKAEIFPFDMVRTESPRTVDGERQQRAELVQLIRNPPAKYMLLAGGYGS
jgi:hypothetical protein